MVGAYDEMPRERVIPQLQLVKSQDCGDFEVST